MDNPTNQIDILSIKESTPVNLGASIGEWQVKDDGVFQTLKAGNRKAASGTILLYQISSPSAMQQLQMKANLASVYYTGIIFNYRDKRNFYMFMINRGAVPGENYTIDIAQVVEGDYRNVCKEKHPDNRASLISFVIRNEVGRVIFEINKERVFQWEGIQFSTSLRLGLYSQQNDDAVFKEFQVDSSSGDGQVIDNSQQPVLSEQNNDRINSSNMENINSINSFLNLKKPSSKTTVEFSETFTVPLDSFYNTINEVVNSKSGSKTADLKKIEQLDLRPKRWYRQLREVNIVIANLEELRKRRAQIKSKALQLLDAELNKAGFNQNEINELQKLVTEKNIDYRTIQFEIEKAQDVKASLLRELRTSGYSIGDGIENEKIKELGYDFVITRPIPGKSTFRPVKFDAESNWKDDLFWQKSVSALHKELFESAAIKEFAKQEYLNEKDQLINVEANQLIQESIKNLNEEIDRIKGKINVSKSLIDSLKVDLELWEADKLLVSSEIAHYKNYYAYEYPVRVGSNDGTSSDIMYTESNKLYNFFNKQKTTEIPTELTNRIDAFNQFIRSSDKYAQFISPTAFIGSKMGLHVLNKLQIISAYFDSKQVLTKDGIFSHALFYPEPEINSVISRTVQWGWSNSLYYIRRDFSQQAYTTLDIKLFLSKCVDVCDKFINDLKLKISKENSNLTFQNTALTSSLIAKKNHLEERLGEERKNFIAKWNSSENGFTQEIFFQAVYPDSDPLAEFLIQLETDIISRPLRTYYFAPTENGYVNQHGQGLFDFVNRTDLLSENSVSLFPILDTKGNISNEVIKIIRDPQKSSNKPSLPTIKFIETYKITIGWSGYALGELSHTVNLFPGESKELVVEKKTKITSKTEQSKKEGSETKQNITSSFEDNLQDTFSEQKKDESKIEDKAKTDSTASNSTDSTQTTEDTSSLNWKVEAEANWGWGSAKAEAAGANSSKNTSSLNSKKAFSLATNNEGLRASNQSKDILKKNVSNSIKKVASETSINNKVEISSISSQEFQTELSNKEIIKLENPNVGRTVNYNFFQVQNLYTTSISLIDVKIALNTGQEMIDGTGINDIRVYELEEFGKIYANSNKTDHDVLISSIIARQVMKHYGDFLAGIAVGNGAVKLPEGYTPKRESLEILNYTSDELSKGFTRDTLIEKLKQALDDLKAMPFFFNETEIQSETTVSVNAGSYHLEAQVGFVPATEKYLEDRRDIETEHKKAELAHLQEQTRKGVFYQSIPAAVTHLNYDKITEP